ncbi:MAG: hypothetical protein AABX05_05415 [Nanoarchaeota archaeon]
MVVFSIEAAAIEIMLVDVTVFEDSRLITEKDPFLVEVQVLLVGRNQTSPITDVLLEYVIADKNGERIFAFSETKGGIVRIQKLKEIPLPPDLPAGTYSITVRASYEAVKGEASVPFTIIDAVQVSKTLSYRLDVEIYFLITLVIFLSSSIYFYVKIVKLLKDTNGYINEKDLKRLKYFKDWRKR